MYIYMYICIASPVFGGVQPGFLALGHEIGFDPTNPRRSGAGWVGGGPPPPVFGGVQL